MSKSKKKPKPKPSSTTRGVGRPVLGSNQNGKSSRHKK